MHTLCAWGAHQIDGSSKKKISNSQLFNEREEKKKIV